MEKSTLQAVRDRQSSTEKLEALFRGVVDAVNDDAAGMEELQYRLEDLMRAAFREKMDRT